MSQSHNTTLGSFGIRFASGGLRQNRHIESLEWHLHRLNGWLDVIFRYNRRT
jgi:hypothetical protein